GIIHQLSTEYTPQQNGVAERANRTLVEMARCMMLQANLPESLWAEAVNTATYLRNRNATKCLEGITPIEAWSQRKPYVRFFRTFGSKVIALNKGRRTGKFQPKGDDYVLVGY
ncbi:Copia protein, partial [Dufourea novaeangliae]